MDMVQIGVMDVVFWVSMAGVVGALLGVAFLMWLDLCPTPAEAATLIARKWRAWRGDRGAIPNVPARGEFFGNVSARLDAAPEHALILGTLERPDARRGLAFLTTKRETRERAELGQLLERAVTSLETSDALVGRLGGDEFAILIPRCESSMARAFAHSLFESWSANAAGEVGALCIGVTTMQSREPIDNALARAAQALYLARKEGRPVGLVKPGPLTPIDVAGPRMRVREKRRA